MPTNGNSFVKDEASGYLVPTHNTGSIPFGVESKKRFLALMEEEGDKGKVCDLVGVSWHTLDNHLSLDEAFARDYTITLRRMASKLEGTMFKNAQQKQGYMDRITWLRRWFPKDWTPKTNLTVNQADSSVDELFSKLEGTGQVIDITPQE